MFFSRKKIKRPSLIVRGKPDMVIIFLVAGLSLLGLLMVYNASTVEAFRDFADKYYFLKNQFAWMIIGWLLLWLVSFFDYHWFGKLALPLFIANVLLLILVLVPGLGLAIKGARRWINLGSFVFQPTETLKIALVLYLSVWLGKSRSLLSFLLLIGFILGLIILQPDLGTAVIVVATAFLVYYFSGAKILPILAVSLLFLAIGISLVLVSPYRRQRLKTFLNPAADPLGSSYHIRQALIALGSGGFFGVGLGKSRQKYQYLPEATTDSIFAVIGEETGLFGTSFLLGAFMVLIYRGINIAQKAVDPLGRLIAGGLISWLAIQVFMNISAMVALVPLTGIPLPLISYGGSSLLVTLVSFGILLSVSRYNHK